MTTPETITSEIQKLEPSALVELFILDVTTLGGDVYYFHAGTNELSANVVWQGNTYVRYPIDVTGFEVSSNAQLPRPKLKVSNILSVITALLAAYEDLIGAKLTRKRTMVKYLDAVNFTGGVNATEDNTAEFSSDIFYIDRKSAENKQIVEFELASSIDLKNVKIPRRQIVQGVCPWVYRGAECGFTGGPLFDINDVALTGATTVDGATVLTNYGLMNAAKVALDNAKATVASSALAKDLACSYVLLSTSYTYTSGISMTNGVINYIGRGYNNTVAYFGGAVVTLGNVYRVGAVVLSNTYESPYKIYTYRIEKWEINAAACAAATAALTAAEAALLVAQLAYDAAIVVYDNSVTGLSPTDPLYTRDVCGKRLTSCKLRFGELNPLSFGGFPSAGLIQ